MVTLVWWSEPCCALPCVWGRDAPHPDPGADSVSECPSRPVRARLQRSRNR
ncbi:hypothetical protein ACFPRL_22315 [Pseudoclavibacter helvolus]